MFQILQAQQTSLILICRWILNKQKTCELKPWTVPRYCATTACITLSYTHLHTVYSFSHDSKYLTILISSLIILKYILIYI